MTYQAIASEVVRLPLNERLLLLETLTRSVREELVAPITQQVDTSLRLVCGMLKPDGPPPTDDELREDYASYLIGKYA